MERMTTVTDSNFHDLVTREMRNDFWYRVRRAMSDIFHADPKLADTYRRAVEAADTPLSEQIVVYHDEPLQIAADLAGVNLTDQHIDMYRKAFNDPIVANQTLLVVP
jgi:hypothetical protein